MGMKSLRDAKREGCWSDLTAHLLSLVKAHSAERSPERLKDSESKSKNVIPFGICLLHPKTSRTISHFWSPAYDFQLPGTGYVAIAKRQQRNCKLFSSFSLC